MEQITRRVTELVEQGSSTRDEPSGRQRQNRDVLPVRPKCPTRFFSGVSEAVTKTSATDLQKSFMTRKRLTYTSIRITHRLHPDILYSTGSVAPCLPAKAHMYPCRGNRTRGQLTHPNYGVHRGRTKSCPSAKRRNPFPMNGSTTSTGLFSQDLHCVAPTEDLLPWLMELAHTLALAQTLFIERECNGKQCRSEDGQHASSDHLERKYAHVSSADLAVAGNPSAISQNRSSIKPRSSSHRSGERACLKASSPVRAVDDTWFVGTSPGSEQADMEKNKIKKWNSVIFARRTEFSAEERPAACERLTLTLLNM